ncbi:hypothetical protein GBAR_LOCUS18517 [Geodia barretti]|uniref:Cell division control protein 24 OB domain-containing protein n=1 Tax=Geodia barretti TaxID=519541 RepID=A0AA35SNG2_GEOBA|nr:hypothetical protein GBAR_LOCUS18517 [Geodia barretti]
MEEIIYRLQKKLRGLKKVVKPPTWSFVLGRAVKVLETYPSGVTETIILSELYQEYIRTGGRLGLTQEASSGQISTVGSIHEHRAIDYESLLEAVCTRLWTLPGTTTSVISLKDPGHGEGEEEDGARQVDMYLHRKFQNCTEMLVVYTYGL